MALATVGWWLTSDGDGGAGAPSPLFGEVEQLTLTDLPDGWARCGGGPSARPDAEPEWWTQTFGPSTDGECTPLVTVTQVPPGDRIEKPDNVTNQAHFERGDVERAFRAAASALSVSARAAAS